MQQGQEINEEDEEEEDEKLEEDEEEYSDDGDYNQVLVTIKIVSEWSEGLGGINFWECNSL